MASLTVRQLDEALKQQLRLRAARNGRSVEDEVRTILESAAAEGAGSPFARPRRAVGQWPSSPASGRSHDPPHPAHHRRRHRRL